jgi:hypothetical protein
MIAEAAWRSISLNRRSPQVYGAGGPYWTVDALPSLRLRKRERYKVLRRVWRSLKVKCANAGADAARPRDHRPTYSE